MPNERDVAGTGCDPLGYQQGDALPNTDGSRPGPAEAAAIRVVMRKIVTGLGAAGRDTSPAALSRAFGCSRETIQKRMNGERRLPREFVAAAAPPAGLRTVDLYLDLGWLPPEEVLAEDSRALARTVDELATSLTRLSARLDGRQEPRRSALEAAVSAVLTSPTARDRFKVTLSIVESGARYRVPTYTVAEFKLRDGAEPLPLEEAVERARNMGIPAGGRAVQAAERAHTAVRLELRALTHDARRNGDESSWQGDPGTVTWRGAAECWPTHLLVQSVLTGASSGVPRQPWSPPEPHPLVVVGSSYGAGPAAAMLAEALGWQFILVHNGMTVSRRGEVIAVDRSWRSGRTLAWTAVARHIAGRDEADPWRAVVLVRPQSFAGADDTDERAALEALGSTPARVLYARPPAAYLEWWAARQQGMTAEPDPEFNGPRWRTHRPALLERIETTLRQRPAGHDLLIEIPQPRSPLEPHAPQLPAEIMDNQARMAWAALEWLNIEANKGLPRLSAILRPGIVEDLRDDLARDVMRISPRR